MQGLPVKAERGGFEPPIAVNNHYNGLANRRLQPLGHLSGVEGGSVARISQNVTRLDERENSRGAPGELIESEMWREGIGAGRMGEKPIPFSPGWPISLVNMAPQRNARFAQDGRSTGTFMRIVGLVALIAVWAFVVASLIGFDRADPPSHLVHPPNSPVMNWCGTMGAHVAYFMFNMLGYAAWVLAICITLGLLSAAIGKSVQHALVRLIGAVMMTAAIAGLIQLLASPGMGPMPDLPGGSVGVVGVDELAVRFGALGSGIVLCVLAVVGAVVAMDEWVVAFFGWAYRLTLDHGVPAAKTASVAAGSAALSASGTVAKAGAEGVSSGISFLWRGIFGSKEAPPRRVRATDVEDEAINGRTEGAGSPESAGRRGGARVTKAGKAGVVVNPDYVNAEGNDRTDNDEIFDDLDQKLIDDAERIGGRGSKAGRGGKRPIALVTDEDDEAPAQVGSATPPTAAAASNNRTGRTGSASVTKGVAAGAADSEGEGDEADEAEDEGAGVDAPQVFDADALRAKMAKLPILFGQENKKIATEADLASMQGAGVGLQEDPAKPYRFPGLDLLEIPEENFSDTLKEHVANQGACLMAALQEYRIEGRVMDAESGPAVTMYNVKLAPGTKVAALSAVQSDIARALKAVNIRIVANIAGRDTIGVEVPNTTREKVRLKELMGHTEIFGKMKLPMFLGKDAGGTPLIQDLAKMPHMLIAGTTGSGKSVCMNTIIMGFLYTKRPSELKLVLVDPKMVEMSQFKDIPHLMCPVVTEMPKAAAILEWACNKMEERYTTLQEAGCRDIASYNELEWEELKERLAPGTPEEEAQIPRKLPYIVIVIDELADLMMTNREVEGSIIRIAQKARAVGIHLILATQRPQREVVTGLIKANMPARMTFKVSSGMDSRIVLDQKGGELLLGQGDCLFLTPSSSTIMRAQGTLVDDREIRRVVKFMREVAAPSFERSLMQIKANGSDEQRIEDSQNNSSASLQAAQEDPMFPRAVEIVLETKRGSVSLLQRRLAIGYTRASRLVDLMGIAGIISDHKGSVARDVLITLEEWQAMQKLMEEQAKAQGIILQRDEGLSSGAGDGAGVNSGVELEEVSTEEDDADDEDEEADDEVESEDDTDESASAEDEHDEEPVAPVVTKSTLTAARPAPGLADAGLVGSKSTSPPKKFSPVTQPSRSSLFEVKEEPPFDANDADRRPSPQVRVAPSNRDPSRRSE